MHSEQPPSSALASLHPALHVGVLPHRRTWAARGSRLLRSILAPLPPAPLHRCLGIILLRVAEAQ